MGKSWCHGPLYLECKSVPPCNAHMVPHAQGCSCERCCGCEACVTAEKETDERLKDAQMLRDAQARLIEAEKEEAKVRAYLDATISACFAVRPLVVDPTTNVTDILMRRPDAVEAAEAEIQRRLHVTSTTFCDIGDGMKYRPGGTTYHFKPEQASGLAVRTIEERIEYSAKKVGWGEKTLEEHEEYVWKLLHETVVDTPSRQVLRERDPSHWELAVAGIVVAVVFLLVAVAANVLIWAT